MSTESGDHNEMKPPEKRTHAAMSTESGDRNEMKPPEKRTHAAMSTESGDRNEMKPPEKKRKLNESEAKKKLQSLRVTNCKKWKALANKAEDWVQRTNPYTPSFMVLYLKTSSGREPQLVWAGPEHMASFVDDEVCSKFKEVAMRRKVFVDKDLNIQSGSSTNAEDPLQMEPIELFSSNVTDYTSDVLSLILPRIMNPFGLRGYYCDSNRPTWFPSGLEFKPPTHCGGTETRKYSIVEMQQILKAFLDNCPSQYNIVPDDHDSGLNKRKRKFDSTKAKKGDFKHQQKNENLSVEARLEILSKIKDWEVFKLKAKELCKTSVCSILSSERAHLKDVPSASWDKDRQKLLGNVIPKGLYPVVSTADGNCLYNSVSIALYGNESECNKLRLSTLKHTLDHYDHYFEMFKTAFPDVGDTQQFVCAVIRSDEVFHRRPIAHPTASDLIHYALREELLSVTRLGAYSGPLQVVFLAGAIERPILQYYQNQLVTFLPFRNPTFPCSCFEGDLQPDIHLMWVTMDVKDTSKNEILNHIVPLLPQGGETVYAFNVASPI